MELIVLIVYLGSLLFIFMFSLGQLHLTWFYRKQKKRAKMDASTRMSSWPPVTVQLPVYNEAYVIERLIDSVAQLQYPGKLQIQVLDDSTDDTSLKVAGKKAFWEGRGIRIEHIQREERSGFKAGALQLGLEKATGEFIAIFDADFIPHTDFLMRTIPSFSSGTGVVQVRWGHLNRDYSLLTRLQAFGLDAHFTVEQTGRSAAGSFINFNGTAGVWRKSCITDAGGWSADTLTEDLDLSYRAQLKGWKFKFLEETDAPAELPVIMSAVKSQQYRWNKGAAETARKNLGKVMRSDLSLSSKFHAFFHLLNSSVFVALLVAAVASVPVLLLKQEHPEWRPFFYAAGILLAGFFSIAWFYWTAVRALFPSGGWQSFLRQFPVFLVVTMGLSLHNGLAVLEGLAGIKTPFLRTPKFNITGKNGGWRQNKYVAFSIKPATIFEALLCLYFAIGVYFGIRIGDIGLLVFHLMLCLGFGFVFLETIFNFNVGRKTG